MFKNSPETDLLKKIGVNEVIRKNDLVLKEPI